MPVRDDRKPGEVTSAADADYKRRFEEGNFEQRFNESLGQDDVERDLREAEGEASKGSDNKDTSIREQEEAGASPIKSTYGEAKKTIKGKMSLKKKGGLAGAIIFCLGLLGIGGGLLTPGVGIIQMKEILTGDLNDQLAAMDIRSNYVFRAKLDNMSSGVCSGIQIKCRFTSMNQRQIDRFTKAGFTIEENGTREAIFGRKIITQMTAPDGTIINNPNDLLRARNSSVEVRNAMKRVFNPMYYSLADKIANTFILDKGSSKQKKVTGSNEEERRQSITDATAGETTNNSGIRKTADGREYIMDGDTQVFSDEDSDRFNELRSAADADAKRIADMSAGGKAVSGLIGGVVKGVGVLGAVDSACTVYNTARAVSAAAKVARSIQLIQFAMVINTTADSIKAGDATPGEVEFIGNMLTATDSRETIVSEEGESVENPFYQKSAFDSPGYKVAAYNEAPNLTSRSQQYMVGGGLSGTLASVLEGVKDAIPGDEQQACGFIQSPWVRGAGLVAGVFLAIGSFGMSTAISVAGSVAVSFALPFLEAMLSDIIAGKVISGDIAGVDAGDAYFAGSGALLGGIAQNRGMAPLSSEGIQEYVATTAKSRDEMIAFEKSEASKDPLNILNQYSFLGTFTRSLYATAVTAQSSADKALLSVGSVVSKGFSSLIQPVSAASEFNPDRFTKCNDPGYVELGLDADIFCNIRYGLTGDELAMDTLEVVDFMINNNYITSDGEPQGTYADFMKNCVNREDGWGDTSEENGNIGLECIDGSGSTYDNISYFRIYTIDSSISTAMDGDVSPGNTPSSSTTPSTVGRPDGAVDYDRGWTLADGVDYSQTACDPRTPEHSIVTTKADNNTVRAKVRLCELTPNRGASGGNGNTLVASVISTNAKNMLDAAAEAGHNIILGDGMRLDGGSKAYFSQHGVGLSLDLDVISGTPICSRGVPSWVSGWGSAAGAEAACSRIGGKEYEAYKWLQANAGTYGFHNLLVEPWHWSSSGS